MNKFDFSMKNLKLNSPEAATFVGLTSICAIYIFEQGLVFGAWLKILLH
jgi:hypothetical protein